MPLPSQRRVFLHNRNITAKKSYALRRQRRAQVSNAPDYSAAMFCLRGDLAFFAMISDWHKNTIAAGAKHGSF
jgi:hypothetical protein